MFKTTNWATIVASLAFLPGLSACGSDTADRGGGEGQGSVERVGSVGLALDVAPSTKLASASFVITGPGGFTRTGSINVANSQSLTATIGGIPAGSAYSITLSATSTDGNTDCSGSSTFSVMARSTSQVTARWRQQRR